MKQSKLIQFMLATFAMGGACAVACVLLYQFHLYQDILVALAGCAIICTVLLITTACDELYIMQRDAQRKDDELHRRLATSSHKLTQALKNQKFAEHVIDGVPYRLELSNLGKVPEREITKSLIRNFDHYTNHKVMSMKTIRELSLWASIQTQVPAENIEDEMKRRFFYRATQVNIVGFDAMAELGIVSDSLYTKELVINYAHNRIVEGSDKYVEEN